MIEELRKEIDRTDAELVKLLARRMELAVQIGKEKKTIGVDIHQKTREITILDTAKLQADSLGLSNSFVTDIFTVIFAESRRLQSGD